MTARLRQKLQIGHVSINLEFKANNQGKLNCLMNETTALMASTGHRGGIQKPMRTEGKENLLGNTHIWKTGVELG